MCYKTKPNQTKPNHQQWVMCYKTKPNQITDNGWCAVKLNQTKPNNQQWVMCYKTKPNQTKSLLFNFDGLKETNTFNMT